MKKVSISSLRVLQPLCKLMKFQRQQALFLRQQIKENPSRKNKFIES